MDDKEFIRRVQALGPLSDKHIERLTPIATARGFTLIPKEGRAAATDAAFEAGGRMGPEKTHDRMVEARQLGVSEAFVREHLAHNMVLQVTSAHGRPVTQPTRTTGPMEQCSADLFFMPTPSSGFIGAVLMQDHFSGYVWCTPIKDKASRTVAKVFTRWFEVGFVPILLKMDSGREYLGDALPVFARFKIAVVFSTSTSRAQGGAERLNGVMKTLLNRNRVATESPKWDVALPSLVLAYNTDPISARAGMTPHSILFRRQASLTAQLDGPAPVPVVRGGLVESETWPTEHNPDHASKTEVEDAVADSLNHAADHMITRSAAHQQELQVGALVRVRLSALDPRVRRAEKDKFAKSSLGEYWTKSVHRVSSKQPGTTISMTYSVEGFKGSFARPDLLLA